ncbi:FKBP-type peptidyl-prolyl cis-trans isomerase [Neolewinella antarctica]|uniref:Peptidyl-prolyl cis-trans isomerase n=1 Tax=Neolewinella antarctica TaxID=442734 RepID=A0ABX0X8Z0_9BACT|nr:FKBP-type peptidyl-prolyl cis-trans isomerase [Neolewinella antarctica]NJC25461.1 FKBP-type peptidyl-prolyl cis-trans isomerase [Neolewinella antarctica]
MLFVFNSLKLWARLYAPFLLALSLAFCGNPKPAPLSIGAPEKDEATRSAIEERLITELAPTDDRAGRQRNAIINRAIDQNYDVYAAPEGYFYEIIAPGATVGFVTGDYVAAHYRGSFLDGKAFDDSRSRGEKLGFRLGDLIPAWNLGVQRIKNGGSIRILAPSNLAYGPEGLVTPRGDTLVPAHTVLEFLIEEVESVEPPDGF